MRRITPADWTTVPWRNGGGVTHEICREGPPDAFAWRISLAEVAQSGPFSAFDGIDRVIGLVEGAGFTLHSPAFPSRTLTAPGETFAFSGDHPVHCTLIDGPVRDFNAMVDRAHFSVACRTFGGDLGPTRFTAEGALHAIFVLAGEALVHGLGPVGPHDLVISDTDIELEAGPKFAGIATRVSPRS